MEKDFSKGYKLLCRFFKEIGLYKEFLDYQRTQRQTVPVNTENPFIALGNTSITSWLQTVKRIYVKHKLYETFKLWVRELYPKEYERYHSPIIYTYNLMNLSEEDIINKETRTIHLKKTRLWD